MKRFLTALFAITTSGCFWASGSVHSQGMSYEASGLNAPSPTEMSIADLTSAQAEMVRAQARTVEAHPELLRGYGGYGYGGGAVNPCYYYPTGCPSTTPEPASAASTTSTDQPTGHHRPQHHKEGSEP